MILTIVPIISALCQPNVSSLEAGLIDIFMATIDIINPTISDAKWAVSVKIAIELARYPPIHYAIIKKIETNDTSFNLAMDALYNFKSASEAPLPTDCPPCSCP